MHIQNKIVLSLVITLTIASAASAQRRSVPVNPDEVGVAIALQVAGQPYSFEGKAKCDHAPIASIYSIAAEHWGVQQIDSQRAFTLSLWHPRNMSGDMFSLSVLIPNHGYIVDTVNSGRGRSVVSSGKVSFTTSGAGGTFTINAKTRDGESITGTIKCSAFSAPIAEGG